MIEECTCAGTDVCCRPKILHFYLFLVLEIVALFQTGSCILYYLTLSLLNVNNFPSNLAACVVSTTAAFLVFNFSSCFTTLMSCLCPDHRLYTYDKQLLSFLFLRPILSMFAKIHNCPLSPSIQSANLASFSMNTLLCLTKSCHSRNIAFLLFANFATTVLTLISKLPALLY